jgi:hypothetical protein
VSIIKPKNISDNNEDRNIQQPEKRTKYRLLALRIFLILQMVRSGTIALGFAFNVIYTLIDSIHPLPPARILGGDQLDFRNPAWSNHSFWDPILFSYIALVFEIVLWRWLSRRKPIAWTYVAVMVIATALYALWASEILIAPVLCLLPWVWHLIASAIIGVAGLWLSRKELAVKPSQLFQISASVLGALLFIFITGRYSPYVSLNWAIRVPAYIDIIESSRFSQFPEISLVVFIACCSVLRLVIASLQQNYQSVR